MKITLKIILSLIAFIIIAYSILWFAFLFSLSNYINQEYSNTEINIDDSKEYFIKFSKAKPYGFPFKFGISIIDWQEESSNRRIEASSPINIGYDLLNQDLFVSFSGEAFGRFKPIEQGFGVKFFNDNCILSAKMPLNIELFGVIRGKKDIFELVNFIKDIKFNSGKVEIFDLIDNKKLYEEDHTIFVLKFDKSKYYTSKQDFLENIPQKLAVSYDTEVIQSKLEDRTIPAGLLLYRLAWFNNFKFSANFLATTTSLNFKDIAKDLTVKITDAKIANSDFNSNANLLYKGNLDELGNNNISLSLDTKIKLNQGFIINLLDLVKKYYNRKAYLLEISNNEKYTDLNKEFSNILENTGQFDFSILEDREYNFNLDINLATQSNNVTRAQINSLSLYSKETGFNVTNETIINILKDSNSSGVIVINNYSKIIDILSSYIYGFGKFKKFSDESKEVYKNALILFLKTISDYPTSSNLIDVSIEYKIDLVDLNKTKIGTIEDINKIIPLYYLSLYQAAVKKVKTGDNLKEKIMELIPDFKEHNKILEECMLPNFQEVNENLWREIIK